MRQPYIRRQLSRLQKPGLTERRERRFRVASIVVVLFFACGWSHAIAVSVETGEPAGVLGRMTANPLDSDGAPEAAFLFDATLNGFAASFDRGQSGAVNVVIQESGDPQVGPDSLPEGVEAVLVPFDSATRGNPDTDRTTTHRHRTVPRSELPRPACLRSSGTSARSGLNLRPAGLEPACGEPARRSVPEMCRTSTTRVASWRARQVSNLRPSA